MGCELLAITGDMNNIICFYRLMSLRHWTHVELAAERTIMSNELLYHPRDDRSQQLT